MRLLKASTVGSEPPSQARSEMKINLVLSFLLVFNFIIKFRYNARADWLKQRALSKYRYTQSRCHAISLFVKCLEFSSLFFFFGPDFLYNLENENELFASMDIDHPVRNSANDTVIESQ